MSHTEQSDLKSDYTVALQLAVLERVQTSTTISLRDSRRSVRNFQWSVQVYVQHGPMSQSANHLHGGHHQNHHCTVIRGNSGRPSSAVSMLQHD